MVHVIQDNVRTTSPASSDELNLESGDLVRVISASPDTGMFRGVVVAPNGATSASYSGSSGAISVGALLARQIPHR